MILLMKKKKYQKSTQIIGIESKNKIKIINDNEKNDYGKDYMKIKFSSDDDLPLNKLLKFYAMTIIIRSAFEEDDKFYPQFFQMALCMSYV